VDPVRILYGSVDFLTWVVARHLENMQACTSTHRDSREADANGGSLRRNILRLHEVMKVV